MTALFQAGLRQSLRGEVLTDDVSLGLYATDASLYQIVPVAVAMPRDQEDVKKAVQIAREHGIAIIPRGGGTGLAGQTIGKGLILDLSKYLNQIIELNVKEQWVRVQPGIVLDNLNAALKPHGLHFAPDPATSSRANIGGMLGNNSSGTKSILYGKTVDHVLALKVLLSDGTIMDLAAKTEDQYQQIAEQDDTEGKVYREFRALVGKFAEEIRDRFPKVMRRVGGYNLDEFVDVDTWNLSKLIVGSEGTLGTILEAKLHLVPLPKYKSVCLVHFATLRETIESVALMVSFGPAAVEILDRTVIELSRQNYTTQRSCQVIVDDPAAVLIVEFYGDTEEEVKEKPSRMVEALQAQNLGYAHPIYPEGPSYRDVWTIRKKGLGLMLGMKTQKKPIAFIEDAAIPLDVLPQYIEEVRQVCEKYDTQAAMYAHASVGVIHVRPILDLRQQEDIDRFKGIAEETFQLVVKYKGSWSGEHGDGLVRSPFNERFFGEALYGAFKEVKALLDPLGLMNPGKILDAPPMDHNLRYGTSYQDQPLETIFHYREDGGFHDAVHMCSGVGECRKTLAGTMCPSYMATRDEEHSTRGRSNVLRLAMSGQINGQGLTSPRVLESLELCLSCKACKSECPSNVDMAKLKSEIWQKKYDTQGVSLRERFIRDSAKFARRLSGGLAPIVNTVQKTGLFRWSLEKVAGIERKRVLPTYARETFTQWYRKHYQPPAQATTSVFLFVDTYLDCHEPQVGISAVQLLVSCGIGVDLAEVGCCQRPKISNGFLREAKSAGQILAARLADLLQDGRKMVVCEPSCATALNLDIPDLMEDTSLGEVLKTQVLPLADFVRDQMDAGLAPPRDLAGVRAKVHGHCHEKSIYGADAILQVLQACGAEVSLIDAGCCGMAGSFGYEKEHYALSEKIGRQRLFPAVEATSDDRVIIANGFSCRHQIEHFTGRKSIFWTELFTRP